MIIDVKALIREFFLPLNDRAYILRVVAIIKKDKSIV